MEWMSFAITGTLVSTIILTAVFAYLYSYNRQRYMGIWTLGWAVYALRFICMLAWINTGRPPLLLSLNQLCALLSGILLLWGALLFVGGPFRRFWLGILGLGVIWSFSGPLVTDSLPLVTFPVFFLLGGIYIWTGAVLLRYVGFGVLERRVVGWSFIIWGLHKLDYPFLRGIEWLAPWGYLLGDIIAWLIAIGFLLVHLRRERHELQASHHRYSELVDSMSEGMLLLDDEEHIIFSNRTAARILGAGSSAELERLNFKSFLRPEDVRVITDQTRQRLGGESSSYELMIQRLDGEERIIEVNVVPHIVDGKYQGSLGTFRDNTAHRHAVSELIKLGIAIRQAAEAVVITDSDGRIEYVNPAFTKVTGWEEREVIGRNPRILKSGRHGPEFYAELWRTISGGKPWRGVLENHARDGSLFVEDVTISPVFDPAGRIINYVAVKHDISQELTLEQQLRQTQKMEAIGTLAGGIAHDFNNILYVIMGNADLAQARTPRDHPAKDNLNQIQAAGKRAAELVRQILTFARRTDCEPSPINITSILKETLRMLRSTTPANIEIKLDLEACESTVIGDPTEIHQVIMNLCTNASQAMEESGGQLELRLTEYREPVSSSGQFTELQPGRYVVLAVSDDGPGISSGDQERIFEPFFTTKDQDEGTGMGLAVVHGIIKRMGGTIHVYSEPGEGTCFKVYLPLAETGETLELPAEQSCPRGTEQVLVVDDEPTITRLISNFLQDLGYSVQTFTDSRLALDTYLAAPGNYDVIITDQTMPRMTGAQLAEAVLANQPDQPIILCTGFSKTVTPERAAELGIGAYISKPVTQADLALTIRRLLDHR